ncbi:MULTISPECIES: NifB/NifX family molybdenum-iron cluster-binding protein [Methylomonas]|uniref:NifB/NifX family molybdenum-iron cluster-binding protein n=1 Tax=Methylomonas TaxID=416 RepID=UPI001232F3EC|nr:NifB/NifX family molybdenum-iron cluster-binding protein [Methylomonas rhizoryzae]
MTTLSLKFAVASKDKIAINEHFGHAKHFHIYSIHDDRCHYLETRDVANYCLGQTADESAMPAILASIKDCHSVFVAKIGDGPTEKVNAIGVQAVAEYAYMAIEESLMTHAHRIAALRAGK